MNDEWGSDYGDAGQAGLGAMTTQDGIEECELAPVDAFRLSKTNRRKVFGTRLWL